MPFFKTVVHQNCRKFYKRIYDLSFTVDMDLVRSFEDFGILKVTEFSKKVEGAKDTFEIRSKSGRSIKGVIGNESVLLVVPKNEPEYYQQFERILIEQAAERFR